MDSHKYVAARWIMYTKGVGYLEAGIVALQDWVTNSERETYSRINTMEAGHVNNH